MSAADRREELEARLWRQGMARTQVTVLLTVADEYAKAAVAEAVDGAERKRRQADRRTAIGARP